MKSMKTIISASVDIEALLNCRSKGINISAVCNKALWDASNSLIDTSKIDGLRDEAERLDKLRVSIQDKREKVKNDAIDEFKQTPNSIFNNPSAMRYWSRKTGLSVEELIELRGVKSD
jgi:hypothetical protein